MPTVSGASLESRVPLVSMTSSGGMMLEQLMNDAAFEAFRSGSVPLVCVPRALDQSKVQAWKDDAKSLCSLSFGGAAGVAGKQEGIRTGVHQIWLQSPHCAPTQHLVGNLDARKDLYRCIDTLRYSLEGDYYQLPPDSVELSYLLYDADGASYGKHVDCIAAEGANTKRIVSFLLYLGSPDSDEPWDCSVHGGALRIHGHEFATLTGNSVCGSSDGPVWSDIAPQAGTVVLFDSSKVHHEVVATKRSRACIVGWFGA